MQCSMSHVATTALLLSLDGLRSNLRASNFKKFHGGACPQTPLELHAYDRLYMNSAVKQLAPSELHITITSRKYAYI